MEIEGRFIERIEFPDWWKRIYADEPGEIATFKIEPRLSEQPTPVRIEMLPDKGEAAAIDYLELRQERAGTAEALFTNEKQDIPLQVRFLFFKSERRFTMNVKASEPGSISVNL